MEAESMDEDYRTILAAQGYLELGMFRSAARELDTLSPERLEKPDALEIRALSLMGEHCWEQALSVAERLRATAPDQPGGFIHAAYCLHEMGCTEAALELLLHGPDSLREKPVFYYNVGCYQARLGQLDAAMETLEKSFEMESSLRKSARKDPDLQALKSKL
jgi:tetratricopeptide (TPR) repeat protein